MDTTIIVIATGIIIGIISYFLNRTMGELDKVKDNSEKNTIKISLLENNHTHLTDMGGNSGIYNSWCYK